MNELQSWFYKDYGHSQCHVVYIMSEVNEKLNEFKSANLSK